MSHWTELATFTQICIRPARYFYGMTQHEACLHAVFGRVTYDVAPYPDTAENSQVPTMCTFPLKRKPETPYRRELRKKLTCIHQGWSGDQFFAETRRESDRHSRSIQTILHIGFHKQDRSLRKKIQKFCINCICWYLFTKRLPEGNSIIRLETRHQEVERKQCWFSSIFQELTFNQFREFEGLSWQIFATEIKKGIHEMHNDRVRFNIRSRTRGFYKE